MKGLNSAFQQVDLNSGDANMRFSSEVEIGEPNFEFSEMLPQDTSEFQLGSQQHPETRQQEVQEEIKKLKIT
jgi:hypothetical protein